MKKIFTCTVFIAATTFTFSQSLHLQTLSSGGIELFSPSASLNSTLGELAIESLTSPNLIITQGFQQTYFQIKTSYDEDRHDIIFTVFPNPTASQLLLESDSDKGEFLISIIDLPGNVLMQEVYNGKETFINVSEFTSGQYFLQISRHNKIINRIPFQKL